jgi:hypothetical protein
MSLFPHHEKFYTLLEQHSNLILDAAKSLYEGVQGGAAVMARNVGVIKRLEHDADEITHQFLSCQHAAFVSPIDPDDLHALTSAMDDVIDCIEDSSFRIVAYRVDPIPSGMTEFAEIIHATCMRVQVVIQKLRAGKALEGECIEINRLENMADDLFRRLVTNLFESGMDAISVMKHKEIYEFLDLAVDRCEDVADVLMTVSVKNR